jgi:hypothetical protein
LTDFQFKCLGQRLLDEHWGSGFSLQPELVADEALSPLGGS